MMEYGGTGMNLDRWCLSRTRLAQAIVWGLAVATVVSCAAAGVFAQIDFTFAPMVANLEVSPGGTSVFEGGQKREHGEDRRIRRVVMDVVQLPNGNAVLWNAIRRQLLFSWINCLATD